MEKRKLNTDYAEAISSLQSAMERFSPKKLYTRIFRGRGLEFDRYREYGPSDDASLIDWKASLRTNKILAKQYKEERQLKIMFLVDTGENMVFGSADKLKCEYAAEVAAALSYLIVDYNDKLGYAFFSDRIKKYVPPEAGTDRFQMFSSDLRNPDYYGGSTDFDSLFDYFTNSIGEGEIDCIFLISDFINFDKSMGTKLDLFSRKFEVISFMVRDPLDLQMPDEYKQVLIENPETGRQFYINPKKIKQTYKNNAEKQLNEVKDAFAVTRADLTEFSTNKKFVPSMASFLKERAEKGEHIVPGK